MSTNEPQNDDMLLAAYLDGQMTQEDQVAFLRRAESKPELLSQIQLAEKIDASLHNQLAPPTGPPSLDFLEAEPVKPSRLHRSRQTARRRRLKQVGMVLAACLAWVFVGWQVFELFRDPAKGSSYDSITMATAYNNRIADGWKPDWVCENDQVFAQTFFDRQGQGLLLAAMPEGTAMVGLAYMPGLNVDSTAMLAEVEGERVLVFVDRLAKDRKIAEPSKESGLHLFRKELGSLVVYEISPLDAPRVMGFLYAVDVP